MRTITRLQLRQLLMKVHGATPISFTCLTRPKIRKHEGIGEIYKLKKIHAFLSCYENAVNRVRLKDGTTPDYVARPRSWGRHVTPHVITHTNREGIIKWYLSAQILRETEPIYLEEHPPIRRGRARRLIGITRERIAQFLPPERESRAAFQGVSKEIIHKDVDLENISLVRMGGEVLRVEG